MTDLEQRWLNAIAEFLKHFDRCDGRHMVMDHNRCDDWMDHEATVALGHLRAIIRQDNRMTSRDFGSLCEHFVFFDGDFIAAFVNEVDAKEFASLYEYAHAGSCTITRPS